MNAKKTRNTPADTQREIDETLTLSPADPQPEEEVIDLSNPAEETEEERNARNHTDTTGLDEEAAATDEVIDLGTTDIVGHSVIGGGLEVAPEPASPIGITQPLIPAVEDVADFATMAMPKDELNKLDETDPSKSAAIRSQANWLEDSKQLFKGPDRDEIARASHIEQMDALDRRNRDDQKKADDLKAKRETLENRAKQIASLKDQYENLKQQATNIVGQIKALEALDEPEGGA